MYDFLAVPFLGQYLLLRPGSTAGVQLPPGHFDQLARAAAAGSPSPPWLAELAHRRSAADLRSYSLHTGMWMHLQVGSSISACPRSIRRQNW